MKDKQVFDKVVFDIIKRELERQKKTLSMIPSENFPSVEVLKALGSILQNKYAEGYPGKRYYQGNQYVDQIENLAIERAKELFNAEHANVQPNSGSPANMAVYMALLNYGDKIMGMDLAHGGHLTHGSKVNFSGKQYKFIHYGVDPETELLDMDAIRKMAEEEKPKMIVSGYTAYPRRIDFSEFQNIAEEVGAYHLADISHIAGLCVSGAHPSPLPFTDVVMTTTHKTLRGPRSAIILCKQKFASAIDKAVFPGLQGGPHEHVIAAKAVCFYEALQPEFREYSHQIVRNARALADALMEEGIRLVSGGTDNHLVLADLTGTRIDGKTAAIALEEAGICLNANMIPFDKGTPMKPSGIRFGTPILTTRGMKESEMKDIAKWMAIIIKNHDNEAVKEKIRLEVEELCRNFPIYEDYEI